MNSSPEIPVKHRLQRIGLSVRQFLVLFIIGTIILLAVQLTNFHSQKYSHQQMTYATISTQLEQSNAFINNYVSSIQEFLRTSVMREDLFDPEQNGSELLNELAKGLVGIHSVFVKQTDGKIASSRQLLYDIHGNSQIEREIQRAIEHPNVMLWSEPYYSGTVAATTVCIVFADGNSGKVIAAEANLQALLENLFKTLRHDRQSFIVYSREGNTLLFDRSSDSPIETQISRYPLEVSTIYDGLYEENRQNYTVFTLSQLNGWQFMQSRQNIAGWTVTAVIDKALEVEWLNEARINLFITVTLGFCMIGIAFFMVVFYFTKPVRQLAQTMEKVQGIDSLILIETKRHDEVGRLTQSYNQLVRRIHTLIEDVKAAEQKKAAYEFRMRQSQIGSHFLHNTLFCITSLIRQNKLVQAEDAIRSLAGLLSYSFDGNADRIVLGQEIESLARYIDIQKMRYGDTFKVDIRLRRNTVECSVLKLILQPLVENSIIHGLPTITDGEGKIYVRAHAYGDDLILLVADNGLGMNEETQRKILEGRLDGPKNDRYSSIGISNVQERLKLHYGQKYGVKIASRQGHGTVMRLKIPIVL